MIGFREFFHAGDYLRKVRIGRRLLLHNLSCLFSQTSEDLGRQTSVDDRAGSGYPPQGSGSAGDVDSERARDIGLGCRQDCLLFMGLEPCEEIPVNGEPTTEHQLLPARQVEVLESAFDNVVAVGVAEPVKEQVFIM